jgi:hypothetical protein
MPKFLGSHPMKLFTADRLNGSQSATPDEFGITRHDVLSLKSSSLRLVIM